MEKNYNLEMMCLKLSIYILYNICYNFSKDKLLICIQQNCNFWIIGRKNRNI